jgi:hypothetical protein
MATTEASITEQHEQAKKKISFAAWFKYEWVSKNLGFFLFLSGLAILYIANGHKGDRTIRRINKTAKEIKQLQYEYKTLKSELMFKSREAELAKTAEPLGLELTNEPPMRIPYEQRKTNNQP